MDDSSLAISESGEPNTLPEQQTGTTAGLKRNKVSRACDECRKRKVRCDGAQPCARCQKSGTECVFVKVTPKRGPPKQYVETLEPRLRALEQALDALQVDAVDPSIVKNMDVKSEYTSKDVLMESWGCFADFVPADIASPRTQSNIFPSTDSLSVGVSGQGVYVHDCLGRVDRIPSIYSDSLMGKSYLASIGITDFSEPAQPKMHPHVIAATTVNTELIQLYFTHVHPYLPILHKATFHRQLRNGPCILLLNAMYAVASRWQSTRDTAQFPGWRYYQAAFSLIDIYTDTPRLSTIQALLLLVKYQELVQRPGFFWRTRLYFQLIVRMCNDLGLNKAVPQAVQMDPVTVEQRKRTFWAVYAYDVLMSTELGCEPHFEGSKCTVDYPDLLEDEVQTEDQDIMLHFHWLAKLVHVHGNILRFARQRCLHRERQRGSDDAAGFRMLQQQLDEMGTNMMSVMKPSGRGGSFRASFQFLLLHLNTILLHRPRALDSENSASQERCTDAASAITHITETLLHTGGVECLYHSIRGAQHVIHCLSAAITVHKCLAGIQGHREACEKSLAVMNKLLEGTPAAELAATYAFEQHQQQEHHSLQQPQSVTPGWVNLDHIKPSASSSTPSNPVSPLSATDFTRKARRTSATPAGTSGANSKRKSRTFSNMGAVVSTSNNAPSSHETMPQPTATAPGLQDVAFMSAANKAIESGYRMRGVGNPHRFSMPVFGYHASSLHAAAGPFMTSYSQPPSPTNYLDVYSANMSSMNMTSHPSPLFKQALRSSTVQAAAAAAQQQQQLQYQSMAQSNQFPSRTTSTPRQAYVNRVTASNRRHTISVTSQGNFATSVGGDYSFDDTHPSPLPAETYTSFSSCPQDLSLQQSPFAGLEPSPNFPMDPSVPESPAESMMELLMN